MTPEYESLLVGIAHLEAFEEDELRWGQASFGGQPDRDIAKGLWLKGTWSLRDIAVLFQVTLQLDVRASDIAKWQMEENWPPRPRLPKVPL